MSAGRIVASKYCLLYELGRGGMGAVWAAEHLALRSQVAVKLIDAELARSPDAVRRFEREARAAATLRSQHVVQVLDFGVDAGSPYLVMELLSGESLRERLSRRAPLTPREAWTIMSQVGKAITRAHAQGFVHRDLKPDNVFLVDDDPDFVVKVLDFGIAKALNATPTQSGGGAITHSGVVLGTPHHMSPEQAEGRAVDERSDLWSMGVVAFECVTGRLPFEGPSLPALLRAICYDPVVVPSQVAAVPVGFDAWFARAVERKLERRFQTAKELVEELEPLLAQPASNWPKPARPTLPPPAPAPASASESASESDSAPRLDTYPGEPPERRIEIRIPSSIPAGINRQRDLRHTALIHDASRSGARLATRSPYHRDQLLILTLQLSGPHNGEAVLARVIHVRPRNDEIWKFDLGVEFETPLSQALLQELERRASRKPPDGS